MVGVVRALGGGGGGGGNTCEQIALGGGDYLYYIVYACLYM